MENYTLNRFYHEAKAILEKYHIWGKENYDFHTSFSIREDTSENHPVLECHISYWPKNYGSVEPKYYGLAMTPSRALKCFEEFVIAQTGSILREKVSVEIPEDGQPA